MQPHAQFFHRGESSTEFGEFEEDRLHGRCIYIDDDGDIQIGYWENDELTGCYICIYSECWFDVGEVYLKDGKKVDRGTRFYQNGGEEKYD